MNGQMWGEMLDVLKDIGGYLAKADTEQTRASIDKAPKISEEQKPIKGDGDLVHGFAPGKGVAKSLRKGMDVDIPEEGSENESFTPQDEESSKFAKEFGEEEEYGDEVEDDGMGGDDEYAEEEEEEEEEEGEGGEGEPSMEDLSQLKSLLKDIRSSLIQQSRATSNRGSMLNKAELQKAIQPMIKAEAQRMIRKMGFNPSRPDVVRFGVEDNGNSIQKSMDREKAQVDKQGEVVEQLSSLSWQKLGQIRESLGQFNPFYK
jgi:hypothetical protein